MPGFAMQKSDDLLPAGQVYPPDLGTIKGTMRSVC